MVLIPEFLSATEFWLLIALSGFTSFLTASIGLGGGMLMLAVMAHLLPVKAIIPVHGFVQLGSNIGRSFVLRTYLEKSYALWFILGSALGALIGGQIVIALPIHFLKAVIGVFILYTVMAPGLSGLKASGTTLVVGGALSTALTMFVGATGPFVMAIFRVFKLKQESLVSTVAVAMTAQHLFKVLVFGMLGFVYAPYIPLLAFMLVTGFVGTLLGKKVLLSLDPNIFRRGLNLVLVLLALKLIFESSLIIISNWN